MGTCVWGEGENGGGVADTQINKKISQQLSAFLICSRQILQVFDGQPNLHE